jgi:hypothetical protein
MKCSQCGTLNEPKNKFCYECGIVLAVEEEVVEKPLTAHLFGKEVDVLFFAEPFTEKINGIVNPSPEQKMRYRKDGIVQRVIIESPHASDDSIATVMAFIRQSKEYLGEEFHEVHYHSFSLPDLKKEYLKLFERVLKMKEKRGDNSKPADPKAEKK